MICSTKNRSEFGIVSGFLHIRHVHGSTGSLAKRGQVLLAIKIVHSRCRSGVGLATSTDTYSTK